MIKCNSCGAYIMNGKFSNIVKCPVCSSKNPKEVK